MPHYKTNMCQKPDGKAVGPTELEIKAEKSIKTN